MTPVNGIGQGIGSLFPEGGAGASGGVQKGLSDFGAQLRGKLEELNKSQATGDAAAQDLATGRADDIAQTMLKIEHANVSLQLAMTIRNKAIEAYQEVLRMQV